MAVQSRPSLNWPILIFLMATRRLVANCVPGKNVSVECDHGVKEKKLPTSVYHSIGTFTDLCRLLVLFLCFQIVGIGVFSLHDRVAAREKKAVEEDRSSWTWLRVHCMTFFKHERRQIPYPFINHRKTTLTFYCNTLDIIKTWIAYIYDPFCNSLDPNTMLLGP